MALYVTPLKIKGNKKWAHVEGNTDDLVAMSQYLKKPIWSDARGPFIEINEKEWNHLRTMYETGTYNPQTLTTRRST